MEMGSPATRCVRKHQHGLCFLAVPPRDALRCDDACAAMMWTPCARLSHTIPEIKEVNVPYRASGVRGARASPAKRLF